MQFTQNRIVLKVNEFTWFAVIKFLDRRLIEYWRVDVLDLFADWVVVLLTKLGTFETERTRCLQFVFRRSWLVVEKILTHTRKNNKIVYNITSINLSKETLFNSRSIHLTNRYLFTTLNNLIMYQCVKKLKKNLQDLFTIKIHRDFLYQFEVKILNVSSMLILFFHYFSVIFVINYLSHAGQVSSNCSSLFLALMSISN